MTDLLFGPEFLGAVVLFLFAWILSSIWTVVTTRRERNRPIEHWKKKTRWD